MGRHTSRIARWGARDVETTTDIVRWARALADRGRVFDLDLAVALTVLAEHELRAGAWARALAHLDEIPPLHARAPRLRERRWARVLARTVHLRVLALHHLGRGEDALRTARTAADRYRELVPTDPDRFEPVLSDVLRLLAECHEEAGDDDAAVRVGTESARLGRRLLARGVDHDPAPALINLAARLHGLARYDEGTTVGTEAVALSRRGGDRAALALALLNLGACLSDPAEALRATDEAIALFEDLLDERPGAHEENLVVARRNRNNSRRALGLPEEQVLGPYPLCRECRGRDGGPVAARHRQVHVAGGGRESCVDEQLADLMPALWAVCDTTRSCQEFEGRAFVTPAGGQARAAEKTLTALGFTVEQVNGDLRFDLVRTEPGT